MEELDFIPPRRIVGKMISVNVLDKIRSEIVELQKDYHEYGWAYDDVLDIIDKYMAERSEADAGCN